MRAGSAPMAGAGPCHPGDFSILTDLNRRQTNMPHDPRAMTAGTRDNRQVEPRYLMIRPNCIPAIGDIAVLAGPFRAKACHDATGRSGFGPGR